MKFLVGLKFRYTIILFALFVVVSNSRANAIKDFNIIPQPVRITAGSGVYDFRAVQNFTFSKSPKIDPMLDFNKWLEKYFEIKLLKSTGNQNPIQFIQSDTFTHADAYHLIISKEKITIIYKEERGAFYATQTLKQLFPIENKDISKNRNVKLEIPCGEIYDYPRFSYRGMHMDESRHFFGLAAVKKYIDMLAFQKMNYFHWHLTDDQGWRIEIKKYPKLTTIANCRKETRIGHYSDRPIEYDGKKYCHFYTQEEAKEIVRYASERFITVVPEIEMPGHGTAALSAYPEYGCTGKTIEASTTWGVFEDIFCPKEETFTFLNNVLDEIMAIFPSKMIHVGGDEVPKKQWKESKFCQDLIKKEKLKDEHGLQSYFIKRIEKHINSRGRIMIGWDEILEGGLAPNAVVMSWRGTAGGMEAANQNHEVVMTPGSHCYFDQYQSKNAGEPIAIGGFLTLKKVYSFNPIPDKLPLDKHKYILGGQANLWAEYIATPEHLQYMAYPRSFALAEALWSDPSTKNYDNFLSNLTRQISRLDAWEINYAKHFFSLDINTIQNAGNLLANITSDAPKNMLQYRISKNKSNTAWLPFTEPAGLSESGIIEARLVDTTNDQIYSSIRKEFNINLASAKEIQLTNEPNEKYNSGGKKALVNGMVGPNDNYGGDEWLGFLGKDLEAIIDLNESTPLHHVELRFYNANGQWVYGPLSIEVFGANEKDQWVKIERSAEQTENDKIIKAKIYLNGSSYRYIKVLAKRHGIIKDGLQGAGNEAWLFCDEIVVD